MCVHMHITQWKFQTTMSYKTRTAYVIYYQDATEEVRVFRCICWKAKNVAIEKRLYDSPACLFRVQTRMPHDCLCVLGDSQSRPKQGLL